MATPAQLEVYRQACESYRFHYKLEWQFLQVGVAIGLVVLGLGKEAFTPQGWQMFISGFVFLGFSLAMHRVSKAITDSRPSFVRCARLVGDDHVQEIGSWQWSAAVWGRIILHFWGAVLIVWSICEFDAIARWLVIPLVVAIIIVVAAWTTLTTLSKDSVCATEVLWTVCVLLVPTAFIMGIFWYYDGI